MPAHDLDRRPLFPAGAPHLRGVHRIHAGPLYDTFRATFEGRDLAIKRRAAGAAWQAPVASRWHLHDETNCLFGNQLGWYEHEPAPDASYFDRLLRAEHDVIAHVGPQWNHPGAELARWCDGDLLAPPADGAPGTLCLVMPWCAGQPLASLPASVQRRLLPMMLPALWQALATCPHGDLALSSLMMERDWFRILDPGVCIDGPGRLPSGDLDDDAPHGLQLDSSLLTTNPAHYLLVMPEHGPGKPRLPALPGRLERSIDISARLHPERLRQYPDYPQCHTAPPTVSAPSAADVVACGAIYFAVLSGGSLGALLDLDAPLWVGFGGEVGRDVLDRQQARVERCLAALAGGAIHRALRTTGATPAEISLCERLVLLDVDAAELPGYAAEITRAIL